MTSRRPVYAQPADYDEEPSGVASAARVVILVGSLGILAAVAIGVCIVMIQWSRTVPPPAVAAVPVSPVVQAVVKPDPLPEIAAGDLLAAYGTNELAADARYKGRRIIITGVVGKIGRSTIGGPFITLKGSTFRHVQCEFATETAGPLTSLVPGQTVRVSGVVWGEMLSSVMVDKCTLLPITLAP